MHLRGRVLSRTKPRRLQIGRRLTTLAAVATLLGGCAHHSARQKPIDRELASLTSDVNGLTYPPYLRGEPGDVRIVAFAARIVTALDGSPPRVAAGSGRKYLVEGARAYGPVSGRWLVLPYKADLHGYVDDIAAVRGRRSKDGWYADYSKAPRSVRIQTTARALALIASAGGIDRSDAELTGRWLRSQLPNASLTEAADVAEALATLHQRIPRARAVALPGASDFRRLSQDARSDLLVRTAAYVRSEVAAGRRVSLDREVWLKVFDASVGDLPADDLETLILVLLSAGVPPVRLNRALLRFRSDQLPDGLFRDPQSFAGDPRTTLYALALRGQAGVNTTDRQLSTALAEVPRRDVGPIDPDSELVVAAGRDASDGSHNKRSDRGRCGQKRSLQKIAVRSWQLIGLACDLLGRAVAIPAVRPWSPANPEGGVAAARLVNTLRDADPGAPVPAWVRRPDLVDLLGRPGDLGNIENLAEVARAAIHLGGPLDPSLDARLQRTLASAHGCPGLPDLYRAVARDRFGCDLATTLSVRLLQAARS